MIGDEPDNAEQDTVFEVLLQCYTMCERAKSRLTDLGPGRCVRHLPRHLTGSGCFGVSKDANGAGVVQPTVGQLLAQ